MDEKEVHCVVEWVDGSPIIDGAKCFTSMESAVKYAEQQEQEYEKIKQALGSMQVRYTIPRIYLVE